MASLGRSLRESFDWPLFLLVSAISTVGVLNLYSATSALAGARGELYIQQIYWLVIGAGLATLVAAIDYRVYERYAYLLYALNVTALIGVFLVGSRVRGTYRWIPIGSFQFQPSEFMKIAIAVAVARYLHHDARIERRTLRDLIVPGLLIGVPLMLILRQPDLGTAMIVGLVGVSVMALTRLERSTILTLLVSAPAAAVFSYYFLMKDYQRERLLSFWYAEEHRQDLAYQATQSVIAVGSGGFWGQGFMRGTQNQRRFIPDPFTDFPLAVWSQEQGLVGNMILVTLYLGLILWALRIASLARDRFGAALAVGMAGLFFWQAMFNMGMVMRVLPVVGVTLPLFSYGGSSVFTMLIAIGILMNVSMRRQLAA